MTLGARLLVLLLAIVPAIWGMCPCSIAECCADEEGCCSDEDPCGNESAPGREPSPQGPCKGCALMDAGHGLLPPMPCPSILAHVVFACPTPAPELDASAACVSIALAADVRAPGPPRGHAASMVLLI